VSVRRPRRIFSGQTSPSRKGSVGRTVVAGLFGAMVGAFVVMLALPSDLFGRVPQPSGSVTAEPSTLAVVDGDTMRVQETVLRLQGVEAPPRGHMCSRADGTSFDCGAAAAAALADLVRDRRVVCRLAGRDNAGYPEAQCQAGETDLNRRLVADGWARARADAPTFGPEESRARAESRGLWRGGLAF
jgi:endonuclease YncB( thermonuclease family)